MPVADGARDHDFRARLDPGPFGSDLAVAALAFVLRGDDDESTVWEVPVIDPTAERPTRSQLELIAEAMALILGARSTSATERGHFVESVPGPEEVDL